MVGEALPILRDPRRRRRTRANVVQTDVRNILPAIHIPTLIISSQPLSNQRREEYANTAGSIPGAMLVEIPSPEHRHGA